MIDICPNCNSNLQGNPIPQEYIDQGMYESGATHYSKLIGMEIPEVYDGVLCWLCPDCNFMWPRFTDYRKWGIRASKSKEYAEKYNKENGVKIL